MILVTNDDGIESPGIRKLALALAQEFEVVVAAPSTDRSGSGTGIGRFDPKVGVELNRADFEGVTAYTVDGPPGLAVLASSLGAFGPKPDLVVSGINAGMNTGHSIVHSGTVGAVLTARTFKTRGLAVSLAQSEPWQWDTAVPVAISATRWILSREVSEVLNVNVPARPLDEVAGIHWADLDEFGYFRVANAALEAQRLQFVVGSPTSGLDPACDTYLCSQGFVTVTPLSTIGPAGFPPGDAAEIWAGTGSDGFQAVTPVGNETATGSI
jgi:5'-nucleotidase